MSANTHVLVGIDCPACGVRRVRAFRRRPFRFDASCLCRSAFAILHRGADAPRFDDRDPKDLTPPNGWRLELPETEDEDDVDVEVEDEPELAVAAGRRR